MLGLLAFVLFCEFQLPEGSPFKTVQTGLLALLRGWFLASSSLGGLLRGGSLLGRFGCSCHLQELLLVRVPGTVCRISGTQV